MTSSDSKDVEMNEIMRGAVLPGNSTVELRAFPIPEPGHGQVLIKTKSSTICGSDIRAIYREHVVRKNRFESFDGGNDIV
jgi:threonine dehydrogenase-like Zn-dependent dehydrogenase